MLSSEQTRSIVASAVLAPSADNHHALRFEPTGNGLRVWAAPAYLAYAPHRRWLSELSFGAVIENALIRAGDYGVTSDASFKPDPGEPALLFELTWRPGADTRDALAAEIERRHTNRKFFSGPPLAPDALAQFAADAARFPSVAIHWCDAPAARAPVLRLMRRAEAERFCRPRLHAELFGAIRWDVGWHSSCEEGLPPGALEVEPPLRPFFKALASWPLMRALSRLGTHRMLAMRAAYLPARLAPHLGVLTTASDSGADTVAAGRCFQRIWLRVGALGCALQPFAASPALMRQAAGDGWVSPETKAALESGWARMHPGRRLAMIFRVGRAATPSTRAGRRPVDAYIATAGADRSRGPI